MEEDRNDQYENWYRVWSTLNLDDDETQQTIVEHLRDTLLVGSPVVIRTNPKTFNTDALATIVERIKTNCDNVRIDDR